MQDLRKNYWGAESFCVQRLLVYYCEVLKDSEGIKIVVFLPEKMQFLSEKNGVRAECSTWNICSFKAAKH